MALMRVERRELRTSQGRQQALTRVEKAAEILEQIPSSLIPHPSSLIPHPSSLIPHPSTGLMRVERRELRTSLGRQQALTRKRRKKSSLNSQQPLIYSLNPRLVLLAGVRPLLYLDHFDVLENFETVPAGGK
jgi:hypothetical protein